jgi:tetratricopeptide (TPR) repeat protein
VGEFLPHVVHLTGHGKLDGVHGTFAFENERGHTASTDVGDLAVRAFHNGCVRCIFLNGCQTAQAAVAGLCQGLVTAAVPLAIGWSGSVADDRAAEFMEAFYERLVSGEPVPAAVARARQVIQERGRMSSDQGEMQDATFVLPQVYCSSLDNRVFDPSVPARPYVGPRTEHMLLGDGIHGLREGYVGRRREGQKLLPAVRDGEVTFAILTGLAGAGKSALATRAANRLQSDGFHILPVRTPIGASPAECAQATVAKLIAALDGAFSTGGRADLHGLLTDGRLPLEHRLRLVADSLNELRLVLVLDNFEETLELETRRIAEPELARFYVYLATHLTQGSRVLLTCRYLPADTPTDVPTVLHLPLPDFEEYNFRKFLRRDPRVEDRIRRGEIRDDLLGSLYRHVGGTPGFLESVREVLSTAEVDDLADEMAGAPEGPLQSQREQYYERIFAARLYAALPPAARDLVSRMAVSELPLPADALAQISALGEEDAAQYAQAGVVYGLVQEFREAARPALYQLPGLLRGWLGAPERLAEEHVREVHNRLAAFWQLCWKVDRQAEMPLPVGAEVAACRHHARLADNTALVLWATPKLVMLWYDRQAQWQVARNLLRDTVGADRDPECLIILSRVEEALGNWQAARDHLQRATAMLPDGTRLKTTARHNLASMDLNEGNHAAARQQFQQLLRDAQASGDTGSQGTIWHQLATMDAREGNRAAARPEFEKAMALQAEAANLVGVARALEGWASLELEDENFVAAREKFALAARTRQNLDDHSSEANILHQLATIDAREDNFAAARLKFEEVLQMQQDTGNRIGEAAAWHQLALLDAKEARSDDARQKFEKELRLGQAIGDRATQALAWHEIAVLDAAAGDDGAAREKLRKALELWQALPRREEAWNTLFELAKLQQRQGNHEAARTAFVAALHISQALKDHTGEVLLFLELANLALVLRYPHGSVRLDAISHMIQRATGQEGAERSFEKLATWCQKLGYSGQKFKAMLDEITEAYREDRGHGLIERVFAGEVTGDGPHWPISWSGLFRGIGRLLRRRGKNSG